MKEETRRKKEEADNRKVEMPSTIKRSQDDKQLPASKKLRTCTDRANNQTEIDANHVACVLVGMKKTVQEKTG